MVFEVFVVTFLRFWRANWKDNYRWGFLESDIVEADIF